MLVIVLLHCAHGKELPLQSPGLDAVVEHTALRNPDFKQGSLGLRALSLAPDVAGARP